MTRRKLIFGMSAHVQEVPNSSSAFSPFTHFHARPWMLQLITAYVSRIMNKILLLKLELHNNSLYEDPCSTSCVIILIFFTFTYCTDLLTVFFLHSHKYLHDSASQRNRVSETGLGARQLTIGPCHFSVGRNSHYPTQACNCNRETTLCQVSET